MTEPRQPPDHPTPEPKTETHPGSAPQGVPVEMDEHEPKGQPSSDRHQTETAVQKSEGET